MHQRRRIGAYGLCRDREGAVLLVRAAHDGRTSGQWSLPGGGVRHGEHPRDAVVREVLEETGIRVAVTGPREVVTDLVAMPDIPAVRHLDRIIFDVTAVGGSLRPEVDGSSDEARWLTPSAAAQVPLMPYAAAMLGLPMAATGGAPDLAATVPARIGRAHQRFAAYGLATDPAGRVLLTRIAPNYPGAGRWHLPGGGTHFGESAVAGLVRELYEETGQVGHIDALLHVSHRRHHDVVGPEGVPIDYHGVRVVYRVAVAESAPVWVVEGETGSTAEAGWFERRAALALPLTEIAHEMIETHLI
jgi:ADP-ribose pyrophosphatase YjhB (NUDIX family)